MRRMLSFFLVILLALRGLAGDAVAMDLLPTVLPSVAPHAAPSVTPNMVTAAHSTAYSPTVSAMPAKGEGADRALHAGHRSHGAPFPSADAAPHLPDAAAVVIAATAAPSCADSSASPGCEHGAPCASCLACHSAAPVRALQLPPEIALPQPLPASASAHFASALPLRASRPPIL